jgi:hypothetical protein
MFLGWAHAGAASLRTSEMIILTPLANGIVAVLI